MLLCDIGNTSYHFLNHESDYKENVKTFNPQTIQETVYYICVNTQVQKVLDTLKNWIDLSQYIDKSKYYETMGIDRIFACEAISDGVIIDAGSAITVDLVVNGSFEGRFIYPGIDAMRETYKRISPVLDYPFNYKLDVNKMPKNSKDAISYGYLKTLYAEVISYEKQIFLTGGNSQELLNIFPRAQVNSHLIFDGMKKTLQA